MLSILSQSGIIFLTTFNLSPANALNLVQSEKLLFSKELKKKSFGIVHVNSLSNDKFPDWSKLKPFADDKLILPQVIISFIDLENALGKGENADRHPYSVLPCMNIPTIIR